MCTHCSWRQFESRGCIPLAPLRLYSTKLNSHKCPSVNIYYTKTLIHCAVSSPENWTRAFLYFHLCQLAIAYATRMLLFQITLHFSSQNSGSRSNECRELKKDDYRISPPSVCFPTLFLYPVSSATACDVFQGGRGARSDAHYCSVRLDHRGRALFYAFTFMGGKSLT